MALSELGSRIEQWEEKGTKLAYKNGLGQGWGPLKRNISVLFHTLCHCLLVSAAGHLRASDSLIRIPMPPASCAMHTFSEPQFPHLKNWFNGKTFLSSRMFREECQASLRVRRIVGPSSHPCENRGLIKQSGYANCPIYKYIIQALETSCRLFTGVHVLERSLVGLDD